jgi:hypothetical protein
MTSEVHEGGCLCGDVRYRVHGEPIIGLVCHCTFCQRRAASGFGFYAYFDEKAVEFLRGRLAEYEHRSDESGRWLRLEFCPRCGVQVSHTTELRPGMRGICAGTFDQPDWFHIHRHVWTRSKRPWVAIPEGMDAYEKSTMALPPVAGAKS